MRAASIVSLYDAAGSPANAFSAVGEHGAHFITHGGMAYGAGYVAASQAGVKEIVDPRLSAVGDIAEVFRK